MTLFFGNTCALPLHTPSSQPPPSFRSGAEEPQPVAVDGKRESAAMGSAYVASAHAAQQPNFVV
ncbi:MAG: hypothetical protein LBH84_02630 [Prevotellaceae bacterium]|nr:hypothetical protein [Prevotellaceae bacterium]